MNPAGHENVAVAEFLMAWLPVNVFLLLFNWIVVVALLVSSIPGPVQRLDQGGVYTKERSQTEYNNLIKELTEFAPNSDVANTFQAKAYGWNQKGASMYSLESQTSPSN